MDKKSRFIFDKEGDLFLRTEDENRPMMPGTKFVACGDGPWALGEDGEVYVPIEPPDYQMEIETCQ